MGNEELTSEIRQFLVNKGAELIGFADIEMLPEGMREGFPGAISVACTYPAGVIERIKDGPTGEYLDMYNTLNSRLNGIVTTGAEYINSLGYNAQALQATIDISSGIPEFTALDSTGVTISHKTIATLGGIGWIGRTDLLITPTHGPRVRLASILTDAPLVFNQPVTESRCEKCEACVAACPVNAARASNWNRDSVDSERYNVRACHRFTRTISAERGLNKQLCGICISACPVGGG